MKFINFFLIKVFWIFSFILSAHGFAQVGINTTLPAAGSILDIESTDKGMLIPRVDIADLNNISPITGGSPESLLVYNTNATTGKGFYYWNGTIWVSMEDLNLAKNDLVQSSETRTYNMNGDKLGFTNGQFGINTNNPAGSFEARSNSNFNAFLFVQEDNLTGEKDVFTVDDQDNGGGSQDHSSSLKIIKSGNIHTGDDGFSLVELANTGIDPGANKYWISGRKTDEGAPLWGVDITDSDIWSSGGMRLGVTTNSNGSYSNGNFIVEQDGDTGIKTTSPNGALEVNSSNSGVVFPRVSLTATNVAAPVINPNGGGSPIAGTFVYNTNTTTNGPNEVSPGLYMWNGTRWVSMFERREYKLYEQDASTVTQDPGNANTFRTTNGNQNVPGLINRVFTPKFSGTYQMKVSVNFGSGQIKDPNGSNIVSVGTQEGTFRFSGSAGIPTINIYAHSFSSVDRNETTDKRYAIWREATTTRYVTLTAGTSYTFTLRFTQYQGTRFINNGNSGDGRGYVGLDIPCSVEFTYTGE